MRDVTGIVLCGGLSTRFSGRDKALLLVDGETLLDRAAATLGAVAGRVVLATGGRARYRERGLPVVVDEGPASGPLAGIAAGLAAAETDIFVVLAVDMPAVTPAALRLLLDALPGYDLVMPRTGESLEPLVCAGRTAPCLAAARALLHSDAPAPRRLADAVNTRRLDASVAGEPLAGIFGNINSSRDLPR